MAQAVKTLLLSQKDLIEAGVMNMERCVDVIEEVFSLIGKGDYLMGGPLENEHGQMIYFPKEARFPGMPITGPDRRFMAMIAYLVSIPFSVRHHHRLSTRETAAHGGAGPADAVPGVPPESQ